MGYRIGIVFLFWLIKYPLYVLQMFVSLRISTSVAKQQFPGKAIADPATIEPAVRDGRLACPSTETCSVVSHRYMLELAFVGAIQEGLLLGIVTNQD